jgi:hypothetical protein
MVNNKELTLNNCNIDNKFTFPGSRKVNTLLSLDDFIDEDTGEKITLACVAARNGVRTYKELTEKISKIIKK